MTTAELFNTDASKNDKPPPNGAPQGGLALKRVSATFRVVMAGIADCWAVLKTLKSMAFQEAGGVAITGGNIAGATITATCTVLATAADTSKVFGKTPQQLYDLLYPVGEGRLFFSASTPPVWPGVTAVWALSVTDRYLRTADPLDAGTVGGNASVDTSSVSGGNTGGTVLTMANLPADLLVNAYGDQDHGGLFQKGNSARLLQDANAGGGQAHVHTGPTHAHSVSLTPLYLDVSVYLRIS